MSWLGFVRVLHVLLGVFWAGTMFFFVAFLEPSLRALGPDGGRVMQALQRRRFLETMITVGTLTLLSGLVVFWQISAGFSREWLASGYGHTIMLGATAGVLALAVGVLVSRPTLERMRVKAAAVAAGGAPPDDADVAELDRLRGRLRIAARFAAALLLLSVLCMAAARYV